MSLGADSLPETPGSERVVANTKTYYGGSLPVGSNVRLTVSAFRNSFGGPGPPTGTYTWAIKSIYQYSGTSTLVTEEYHGIQSVVDRFNSPYGRGWWIDGLDQLVIQEDDLLGIASVVTSYFLYPPGTIPSLVRPRGITYVTADGDAIFLPYHESANEYVVPSTSHFVLSQDDTGFTIETPQKERKYFSVDGYLKSVVEPNGQTTTYEYNADHTLHSVTDPFGRTALFGYTNGSLSSITDADGRVTAFTIVEHALQHVTMPAPAQGLSPVEIAYSLYFEGNSYATGLSISTERNGLVDQVQMYGGTTHNARVNEYGYGFIQVSTHNSESDWDLFGAASPFDTSNERIVDIVRWPFGVTASAVVDRRGLLTRYTDYAGNATNYERDDSGHVTAITMPGQSSPTYALQYDSNGNLIQRTTAGTDALPEAVETWTYDDNFNVPTSYTDALQHQTLYDIDQSTGNVKTVQQVIGSVDDEGGGDDLFTHFTYTAGGGGIPAGLIASETDPRQTTTRYRYEVNGGELKVITTSADGLPEETERVETYDLATMTLVEARNERQKSITYTYDDINELTQVTGPAPVGGAEAPIWKYSYNRGEMTTVEDPRHDVTTYAHGTILGIQIITLPQPTAAASSPQRFVRYWAAGSLAYLGNYVSELTGYFYDRRGNLEDVMAGQTLQAHYEYNALNLVESMTDANGAVTNYEYDTRGTMTDVFDPPDVAGVRPHTAYTYDNAGRMTSIMDPMGRVTNYEYDDVNRLARIVSPSSVPGTTGSTVDYEYDGDGNTRFEIHDKDTPYHQTIERQYDALNRLTMVIEPPQVAGGDPATTSYTYYPTGEVHTLSDPNGNLTTWNIDNLGRVTSVVDPLGHTTLYGYDPNGNLVSKIDRDGRRIEYSYDALNELTTEKWFADGGSTVTRTITYGYDLAGRLTSASDPSASYAYSYDTLDRETSAAISLPGLPTVALNSTVYDLNGNRKQLEASIGGTADFVNYYNYDNLNRLIEVGQTGVQSGNVVASKQVGLAYNLDSQLTNINRFNHFVSTPYSPAYAPDALATSAFNYDGVGRLTSIVHDPSQVTPITQAWTYNGQLNRVATYSNSSDNSTLNYSYNARNELIAQSGSGGHTYEYDQAGNVATIDGTFTTVDTENRLLDDGRYQYQYDNEGNLVNRYDTAENLSLMLSYDNRNRLVEIDEVNNENQDTFYLNYDYDAFNRRVGRTQMIIVQGSEGHPTTVDYNYEKYFYDGQHVVLDFYRGYGGSFSLDHRYLYGPGTDQLLAQENMTFMGLATSVTDPVRVYWPLTDNLGTVRDLVGADGSLIQHYKYNAFGQILAGNTALTRYLYTGREFDPATGLQYNRNRWYDSASGRWISEDPSGFAGGDYNLYRYVGNNPTNATDPSGMAGERPNQINGNDVTWLNEGWGMQPRRDGRIIGYYTTTPWYQLSSRIGQTVEWAGGQIVNLDGYPAELPDPNAMTREQAVAQGNMLSTIGMPISMIGGAGSAAGRLVHLTTAEAGVGIDATGELIGNIYAGPLSNAGASGLGVTWRTGLTSGAFEAAVPIPQAAQGAFSQVQPIGVLTGWQRMVGMQYTANGTLNLGTGAFTRIGINTTQALWYGVDVGLDAYGCYQVYQLVPRKR